MTAQDSPSPLAIAARHTEDALAAAALLLMAFLPAIEPVLRKLFDVGIPGTSGYVENLTLWVAYLGAMVATREKRHLSLSTGMVKLPPTMGRVAKGFVDFLSTAVAAGLFWASLEFIRAEMGVAVQIGGWLPASLAEAILPIAFGVTVLRFGFHAGHGWDRVIALLGIPAAAAIGFLLAPHADDLLWPGIALLGAAALLGAPIFVALGGAALLLFFAEGVPVAAIPVETYRVVVSPSLPTIPLFTLAGYLLAEGGASQRLVRLFRAWFAWLPGGAAIATTLVCAFFSTFTGASGVTILALGGLLLPVLIKSGYSERFAVGLVTSTGSIGLLLPPSLAVILYGVVAHISIPELFKAAVGPGLLMIGRSEERRVGKEC
jgi:TRAP-type C4-dicarboxylate transport system permease small subunit